MIFAYIKISSLYPVGILKTVKSDKAISILAWTGFRKLSIPEFLDSWHMKVAGLSDLYTDCLYPLGDAPGTHFC